MKRSPKQSEPVSIRNGLRLCEITGRGYPRGIAKLLKYAFLWRSITGEAIAAASYVYGYRDSRLFIKCRTAVWANELKLISPDIIKRLHESGEAHEIKELCFSYINYKAQQQSKTPGIREACIKAPGPEAEAEAERIASLAAAPELQKAVKRAYLAQAAAEINGDSGR